MEKKNIIFCIGAGILSSVIFFVSYYGSLYFSIQLFAPACTVITLVLAFSTEINRWAVKYFTYGMFVLVLTLVFQKIRMYEIVGKLLDLQGKNTILSAEDIVINNCVWFGIIFFVGIITFIVSAVISYVRSKNDEIY